MLGALLSCASRRQGQSPQVESARVAPPAERDSVAVSNPRVEVFCSPVKLRTGVVRLVWTTPRSQFLAQELEITDRKDGFEKGMVAELTLRDGKEFQLAAPRQERASQPLRGLRVGKLEFLPDSGIALTEVEGLEPGITYFWRVKSGDEAVQGVDSFPRIEAPTCPADMREERH
jgi:hypothetical protein